MEKWTIYGKSIMTRFSLFYRHITEGYDCKKNCRSRNIIYNINYIKYNYIKNIFTYQSILIKYFLSNINQYSIKINLYFRPKKNSYVIKIYQDVLAGCD